MSEQQKGHIHVIVGTHGNFTVETFVGGPQQPPMSRYMATADEFAAYLVGYTHSRSTPLTISVEVPPLRKE